MIVNACVVQDSPVFFDKEQTFAKVEKIVHEHAKNDLILFPESFIPGYPRGFDFGTVVGSRTPAGRQLYRTYYDNSVDFGTSDRDRLETLASETNTFLVIGITENAADNGSLYCSMAYISPRGGLLGVHRKIKPTGQERVIWAESDGTSLCTFKTSCGILGGLICWENYMPLARQSMYRKGVEIYLAPTADARDTWIQTMRHIAVEGRCFVLGANQYFNQDMYPPELSAQLRSEDEPYCRGGSVIVSPLGEIVAGPIFDENGILEASLDLNLIVESKLDFDANGHYTRPDIFAYNAKGQPETIRDKEIED